MLHWYSEEHLGAVLATEIGLRSQWVILATGVCFRTIRVL